MVADRSPKRGSQDGGGRGHAPLSLWGALRNRDQDPLEVAEISHSKAHLPYYGRGREGMGSGQVPGLFLNSPLRSSGLGNSAVACPKVVN